jgi:uncharacterized protein YbjT (DUF2867 family)
MKIVIVGGTGLIGSKTVAILRQRAHQGRRRPCAVAGPARENETTTTRL